MKCPACGFENKAEVKFCVNCGAALRITCPNCGTVNSARARFCTICGRSFVTAPPPPAPLTSPPQVVIVKQGAPGWVWALGSLLVILALVGGLGWLGVLPLSFLQPSAPPTQAPVVQPEDTNPPVVLASVESYCPQSGGVILYWNAGYDCENETGDPGYRMRVGDGMQSLDTGHFDNQASAIYIPPGWSVKLYEDASGTGTSVCFNSSVTNFEQEGSFPSKPLAVNDNVSSMEIFADSSCGVDLAAGAEPAPLPAEAAAALGLDAPADTGCTDAAPCACLPDILKDLIGDAPPWVEDHARFSNGILEAFDVRDATGEFVYGLDVEDLDPFLNGDLTVSLSLPLMRDGEYGGSMWFDSKCEIIGEGGGEEEIQCLAQPPPGFEFPDPHPVDGQQDPRLQEWYTDMYQMNVVYRSEAVTMICFADQRPDGQGGGPELEPSGQTTQQSCDVTHFCPQGTDCRMAYRDAQGKPVYECVEVAEPEPAPVPQPQCAPWDSCCLNPGMSGCP